MMKKLGITAMLLCAAGIASACGAEESSVPVIEPNGNTVDLVIEARNFAFNEREYRVHAGDTVNVTFNNAEGVHAINIKGYKLTLNDGESASFVAAPGEYPIVCSIMCGPGHSGMKSTLIVE